MAIRLGKIRDRHARHQKILQNSVLDQRYALRGHAFVIVRVGPCQRHAIHTSERGIIVDAQEIGQNGLIHFLGECLSFRFAALAMSFEAVSQHFVEKYRRRAPGKKRGPVEGFGQRRFAQGFQVRGHFFFFGGEFLFGGQSLGFRGFKRFHAQQVHPVVGARIGFHDQPRHQARRSDLASFARNKVGGRLLELQRHRGTVHVGIFPKGGRIFPNLVFPILLIERDWSGRLIELNLGFLRRKIRRLVFLGCLHRGVGHHFGVGGGSAAVFAVGQVPQRAGNGIAVVRQRQRAGGDSGIAIFVMRVVAGRAADAHGHVGPPVIYRRGGDNRPVRSRHLHGVLVVNFITEEVRRGVGLRQ